MARKSLKDQLAEANKRIAQLAVKNRDLEQARKDLLVTLNDQKKAIGEYEECFIRNRVQINHLQEELAASQTKWTKTSIQLWEWRGFAQNVLRTVGRGGEPPESPAETTNMFFEGYNQILATKDHACLEKQISLLRDIVETALKKNK